MHAMTSRADRLMEEQEMAAESGDPTGRTALAWLPAGDYEQALTLWPELAGSDLVAGPDGPLPHRLYCRAMQERLVEFAEAGAPGLSVAPIRVAPFTAWCTEKAYDPDSAEARAEFAAHLASGADPDVVSWPPRRNQPCWCGSGRKYKKCCAAKSVEVEKL
jgi:SEC-C motif-containing protein